MPEVHHVKKARKDYPDHGITKGQEYWWWCTRTTVGKAYVSHKHYSTTYPKRSRLTNGFLSQVYSLQEEINDANPADMDDLQSMRDEWVGQINELESECQSSLDNMPEGLKQGPSGELLQERIDAMSSWASDLENTLLDDDDDGADKEDKLSNSLSEIQDCDCGF